LINIKHCPFNTSPHKKRFASQAWKVHKTLIFNPLIHFYVGILNKFPECSFFLFPKCSIEVVSVCIGYSRKSYPLMSFAQQSDTTLKHVGVVFLLRWRDCNQSLPTTWPLSRFHPYSYYISPFCFYPSCY
jgi:hypothetical protein